MIWCIYISYDVSLIRTITRQSERARSREGAGPESRRERERRWVDSRAATREVRVSLNSGKYNISSCFLFCFLFFLDGWFLQKIWYWKFGDLFKGIRRLWKRRLPRRPPGEGPRRTRKRKEPTKSNEAYLVECDVMYSYLFRSSPLCLARLCPLEVCLRLV